MKNLFLIVMAILAIMFGVIKIPDDVKASAKELYKMFTMIDFDIAVKVKPEAK